MPQNNWMPTVLTSGNNAYFAYDHSLLEEINNEQVKIVRVEANEINSLLPKNESVKMPSEPIRKLLSYISSWFFVPDNKRPWVKKAVEAGRALLKEDSYDLIFVTGPPFSSVEVAVQLKKEFDIPMVIDYRDLWYGYHFAMYPTPLHRRLVKKGEYRALKAAEKIVVVNRRVKEKIMEYYKFIGHSDVLIIPHGYDQDDFDSAGTEPKPKDKMVLTYSGLFYEYITPKYVLNAFKELLRERPDYASNIQLQFIGVLRKSLIRQIKKLKLEQYVKVTGYVSHSDSVRKIKSSDVLWLMIGRGNNSDTISTGKLYEYIGSRKPIIGFVVDGAAKAVLKEYKASYISDPYDIQEIKSTIIHAYEDFRLGKLPVPAEEYVEKYRRDSLTAQLTKDLQFLVKVQ
jgi:glycosyltransferase involved in cell wall biosynthesis